MSNRPITFRTNKKNISFKGGTAAWGPRGVAYEQNGFFICMHANDFGLRAISPGYAFTQKAAGSISDWAIQVFDAFEIQDTKLNPGQIYQRIWRPGIDGLLAVKSNLAPSESTLNQAGVALSLLVQKFETLSRFIELDIRNLKAFSHMTRELLIFCCTEIETSFRSLLRNSEHIDSEKRLTTNDYIRLRDPLHLREYQTNLRRHDSSILPFQPFKDWDTAKPTASIAWYDAYNAVKHDRENELHRATLGHCIEAFSAAAIVYCAQFSMPIGPDWAHEPSYGMNQWLSINLVDPDPTTFYVPLVTIPEDRMPELWVYDGRDTGTWKPEVRKI